jgi:hypothetical protein
MGAEFYEDADDFCEEHPDVVILATSILSTEPVLRSLPLTRLKRSTLVVDVLSVKVRSVDRCLGLRVGGCVGRQVRVAVAQPMLRSQQSSTAQQRSSAPHKAAKRHWRLLLSLDSHAAFLVTATWSRCCMGSKGRRCYSLGACKGAR